MDSFATFEQELQNVLNHLYDPPPFSASTERVQAVLGPASEEALRAALLQAIEKLKPAPDVPTTARSWRMYQLLSYRYVKRMTQEETAEQLGITPRHLRREQNMAVHILASALWQHNPLNPAAAGVGFDSAEAGIQAGQPDEQQDEWISQVKEDLTALQRSAPGMAAVVAETVAGVTGLVSVLTARYGVALISQAFPAGLSVAVHPSGLRQILVQSISELARHLRGGTITISAETRGEMVAIFLLGEPVDAAQALNDHLIRELLAIHKGTLEVSTEGEQRRMTLLLPSEQVTVLVVDDNTDLVHFYRRFVQGTRYQIVTLDEGRRTLKEIEALSPDLIVLDAMLPDVDGWELLAHLHAHPVMHAIPVILCSVVREEELAMVLGAALYLPKPVRRQQFLQALDEVSARFR